MTHAATIQNGLSIVRSLSVRHRQNELNQRESNLYIQALENAKTTGIFPDTFQVKVPSDLMGRQVGIKVAALRELAKYAPNHPLVVSQKCRSMVAQVTVMNFCRAGRPDGGDYANFAPTNQTLQNIFAAFPKD